MNTLLSGKMYQIHWFQKAISDILWKQKKLIYTSSLNRFFNNNGCLVHAYIITEPPQATAHILTDRHCFPIFYFGKAKH